MSRSVLLRAQEWRAIMGLVGECREMGDDRHAWREHLLAGVARLTDAALGMTGEMANCRSQRPRDMGVVTWGWQTGFVRPEVFEEHLRAFEDAPDYCPSVNKVFGHLADKHSVGLRRTDVIKDREWYRSLEYSVVSGSYGTDHTVWFFQSLPSLGRDENVGMVLTRSKGRRDFNGRDLAFVSELLSALTPLVGGPLARFSEPSPIDLAPRVRQVLGCLLEGDGDKQIAARLGVSAYTVNQYTKLIFKHFGVVSRTELLARWVRRGWGSRFFWIDR